MNGVNGAIVLPDNWSTPQGISFTPSTTQGLADQSTYYDNPNDDNFSHNTYTDEQWSVMEFAGAVFFPAAGERNGRSVNAVGSDGYYWSATPDINTAFGFNLGSRYFCPQGYNGNSWGRWWGLSVRLVR